MNISIEFLLFSCPVDIWTLVISFRSSNIDLYKFHTHSKVDIHRYDCIRYITKNQTDIKYLHMRLPSSIADTSNIPCVKFSLRKNSNSKFLQ